MPQSLGIELNETKVKLLELETNGKKFKVNSFYEASIPAGDEKPWEENAKNVLRALLTNKRIAKSSAALSIDSGEAIIREIHLPFKNDDQIRKTFKYELENFIHNYAVEELVVDFYKYGETDKGVNLLTMAIPKVHLSKQLAVLEENGIDPLFIDLDVCALFNALSTLGFIESDEPLVIVYGNAKFTKLMYVEGKKPKYIRTIRFAILSDTDLISSVTNILAKELQRFLLAASASTPISLLLLGNIAKSEVANILEKELALSVKIVSILEKIEHNPEINNVDISVPLGLALKCSEIDAMGIDFRKEEYLYKKRFEAIRFPAVIAVTLVAFIFIGLFFYLLNTKSSLKDACNTILDRQSKVYSEVAKKPIDDKEQILKYMSNYYKEIDEKIGGGDYPIEKSALLIWRELFDSINKFRQKSEGIKLGGEEIYLFLTTLSIQHSVEKAILKGEITNREFADMLKSTLKENNLFANAEYLGSLPPTPSGRVNFTIEAKFEGVKK